MSRESTGTTPRTTPILLLALTLLSAAAAGAGTGVDAVMPHYEQIRQRLVLDSVEGIAAPAGKIRAELQNLRADLSPEAAGVPGEKLEEIAGLLPAAIEAAAELETARTLEEARRALYALSKPLVRWRQAAGEGPVVAWCSMKRHSWLQPEGTEIGNPYYGQAMASCGEVLDG